MNVSVRLVDGSEAVVECVIDTGFEGFLTLPPATVERLGLVYAGTINANLADNSNILTRVYWATIFWNAVERDVAVLAMGNRPLVGTALLNGQELFIQFVDGGLVTVNEY